MASRTVLSIAMGSAIAVAGLVGGSIVMASNDTSAPSGMTATTNVTLDQAQSDAFLQALADKLGKDVATLKQAIQETSLQFLAQALADGKLTDDQYNKIKTAIESGTIKGFGIGRGFGDMGEHGKGMPNGMPFGKGPGAGGGGDILGQLMGAGDKLATFLGLKDAAALKTEMATGKSLSEIAAAHGQNDDTLKAELTKEAKGVLDAAVIATKLTQTQADAMLTQFKAHLDEMINMKMGGMAPGFHRGGPKGPGRSNGQPGGGTGTSAPATNSQ